MPVNELLALRQQVVPGGDIHAIVAGLRGVLDDDSESERRLIRAALEPCIGALAALCHSDAEQTAPTKAALPDAAVEPLRTVVELVQQSLQSASDPSSELLSQLAAAQASLLRAVCDSSMVLSGVADDQSLPELDLGDELKFLEKQMGAEGDHSTVTQKVEDTSTQAPELVASTTKKARGAQRAPTTRVKTKLLELLIGHAEELVQIRNTLSEISWRLADDPLSELTRRLQIVATSVMDDLLRTRMRSIGDMFQRCRREVRDLALDLGKTVQMTVSGDNVELDEKVIDAIREPLVHLMRNCVDHGIESAAERERLGKKPQGQLRLSAFSEPGFVVLHISDDGRGVDTERLKKTCVERGVVSRTEAEAMGEGEALQLLFKNGISTAEKVTSVSGRGVGMSVVKSSVESCRGSVDVESQPGKGTQFWLRFPLTMATLKASIVRIGGSRFAVPMTNVSQIVSLQKKSAAHRVLFSPTSTQVEINGELITLIDGHRHLDIPGTPTPPERRFSTKDGIQVFVFNVGSERWGLVVDEVMRLIDIVIKPIDEHMNRAGIFSGASVLGDGTLALVFDFAGVVRCANHALEREMTVVSSLPASPPPAA